MLKSLLRAQLNELAPHEGVGAWQRRGGGVFKWECSMG